MKNKWLKMLLILALAVTVLACTAMAAGTGTEGWTVAVDGATLTCVNDGKTASSFSVSYKGSDVTAGSQYVLLIAKLNKGVEIPADPSTLTSASWSVGESTIEYIDQVAATADGVSFANFMPKSVSDSVVLLGGTTDSPKVLGVILGHGVEVTGKVESFNAKNATTVALCTPGTTTAVYPGEIAAAATTASAKQNQDFAISGVAPGTYDLVVTKAGHLSYTITNVVVDGELDLSGKGISLYAGDMNASNSINVQDLNALKADFGKSVANATNALTDITGEGQRNLADLNAFKAGFGKSPVKVAY